MANFMDLNLREAEQVTDLGQFEDLPQEIIDWHKLPEEQRQNPPGFVTNEGCWNKAKRAAGHAAPSDRWAFTTWWYLQYC